MRVGALILTCVAFCGCSSQPESASVGPADQQAPELYRVRFETSKGDFIMEVHHKCAPLGTDRFYTLVKSGFYDGARFFRVLPSFVVQFGISRDPALTQKWRSANLRDDPVTRSNARGTVSFATSGPDTRTAQVFINLANNARLDAKGFAPFGAVTDGMEVVDQFYSGYGEGPPLGPGPAQSRAEAEGNTYFERDFPKLDYIKKATIQK